MIQPERVRALNNEPLRRGKYVLYWMQAAQRAEYNHALEYEIDKANALKNPVLAAFSLTDKYPDANLRHYYFMLDGLLRTRNALEQRGIQLVVRHQSPDLAAFELAHDASLVVVDAGHLRVQRRWRSTVAAKIKCPLFEVETNLIVPVDHARVKENFSAGTFRPRINKKLKYYLVPVKHRKPRLDSLGLRFRSFNIDNVDKAVSRLNIDRTVGKVGGFHGGAAEAKRCLKDFLKNKLANYPKLRNDPNADCTSNMSPYLHFGQISPLYIALEVIKTKGPAKDAYLEELIVRRELSYNFVFYNNDYDKFKSLPPWVVRTLNFHRRDKRQYNYSLADFENARTHDPYWNAAQKQMLITGKMHGYMRMYWGKKIIEWTKTPRQAFKIALYLNNKYELDGRDPSGFAGVAWCFGKHDRAWAERPVFGKVRYMNAAGLRRKFDPDQYVTKIDRLEKNC